MPGRTPSQTVGPYFSIALPWNDGGRVTGGAGEAIVLTGRVLDGEGAPVPDALVETWQPPDAAAPLSPDGKPHGFGRIGTLSDGTYRIETTLPQGEVPFIDVTVLARGVLRTMRTRVYLAPEAQVRATPAMQPLAASPRLATLVAKPEGRTYRWDIRLQGDGETVFFA
jgi:protocatechuate 3,4-dioxygenase alpha subunit